MYNYNVNTFDPSAYFKGLESYERRQAAKMKQDMMQNQQAQTQQIQDLRQRILSGDAAALNELAAIDMNAAAQAQQFMQMQQPKAPEINEEAFLKDVGILRKVASTGNPANAIALAQTISQAYPTLGKVAQDWVGTYQQDQQAGLAELDVLLGGGKEEKFAPNVSSLQVDQETGQQYVVYTDRNTGQATRVDVEGGKALTENQKINREINKELRKQSIELSKNAMAQLGTVRSDLSLYDEAISAIDKGAGSGWFERRLPSFQESTLKLENVASRLGLNVISATTFGALSAPELRLAMDTAVPMNLDQPELKKWFIDRKKARQKLAKELYNMATTLGKGNVTPAEYLEKVGYEVATGMDAVDWSDL